MPQAHSPTPPAARRFSTRQILALFDAAHGQSNWQQTGFGPRLMNTHFAGVAKLLRWHSVIPVSANRKPLNLSDAALRLLVIPPPTGTYDPSDECWRRDPSTLFETEEFQTILRYVHGGGRLLAFAYRFGDSFTQINRRFSPKWPLRPPLLPTRLYPYQIRRFGVFRFRTPGRKEPQRGMALS